MLALELFYVGLLGLATLVILWIAVVVILNLFRGAR